MVNRDQILDALESHWRSLQALGVQRIGLFGSYARGDAREGRDLDFLVDFEPGTKSLANYMDLKDLLEGLFGTRVDLVIPETLKARLRDGILREAVYASRL